MKPFETERLLLRPLTNGDLDDLYDLYRRPELMRYITGHPRSFEETRERLICHLADHENYGFGLCAAILKADSRMIGRCGLEPVEGRDGVEGEIAWMFKKEFWRRGLATEFAEAIIPYGFERLSLSRIFARADNPNVASIRVMQKVGMRFARSTPEEVVYEIFPPRDSS